MTLDAHRESELLKKQLTERSERFQKECKASALDKVCGIRLTAMPVGGDIQGVRLFNGKPNENLHIPWCGVSWKPRGDLGDLIFPPIFQHQLSDWQPRLRFARSDKSSKAGKSYAEIHWDGLLELGCAFDSAWRISSGKGVLQLEWLFALFATLAAWADRVRKEVGVPAAEYALEPEIYVNDMVSLSLGGHSIHHYPDSFRKDLEPGSRTFPRYPLGNSDDRCKLLALFMQDCWNLGGEPIKVEENDLEIK